MKILFIGDIVGAQGRHMVLHYLPQLIREHSIDFVIANGENSSGGFGINQRALRELADCGVDAFTMGNHTWDNKDIFNFIDKEKRLVRPLNMPQGVPGVGWREYAAGDRRIIVTNVLGRTYMNPADCPFRALDELLTKVDRRETLIFVDVHAEATSEKLALAWYLDGRVSAVVGTHTHVQTNDGRVFPKGIGYLTDAGMTGPRDSILGVERDIIIRRYLIGINPRFEIASGDLQFNGVIFTFDDQNLAQSVEPVNFWMPAL